MTPVEVLRHLNGFGIRVWADNDNLRYSAPKGALTDELRGLLVTHKKPLLSFLTIKPIAGNRDMLPVSYAQQRLWFLDQLAPHSSAYNIPLAVRLRGQLDVTALQSSFDEIVRRHEALRTTFTTIDGNPLQIIQRDNLKVELQTSRVQALDFPPRAAVEQTVQELATEEAKTPFDLTTEPLIRVKLLQLAEHEHVLLVTLHHIVSDGWSMGVLLKELAALYEAYSTGKSSALGELPIQYGDYAVWQRSWVSEQADQLSYWQEQLDGVSRLQLPTDQPRTAVQSMRGAAETVVLSRELLTQLKDLSKQHGVTLFMTLLAAFNVLLSRYSNQKDIAVGTPIANRTRAELEPLIGCFVNTLVLRTDLSGNPGFVELLGRVRTVALRAYEHQDLPFEKLVEVLQPQRELSSTPLFQVMFTLQNAPLGELAIGELEVTPLDVENDLAKFELTLSMEETSTGLTATLEYNRDLFYAATIVRMATHFEQLLGTIVEDPTQPIAVLPLLTSMDQQQLLEWNNTAIEYSTDKCIHELFEEQVDRTPEAVAVVCGDQALTYQELNNRANQLAHHLQMQGVGPEVVVGICIERSLEMVIGCLAILKAGGAYLPLDPTYPQERLGYILSDANVSVVLTENELRSEISGPTAETQRRVRSSNLAYVIYTSGSTGKPKGVAVEHRSLLNLVQWHQQTYSIGPTTRSTQIAAPGFDAAVWEIWPYLATGGSIHIAPEECRHSPTALIQWLNEQSITISFLPTPLAEAVLTENWPAGVKLQYLLTGGDKLRLRPAPGLPFQLINHYGPTESTVVATATVIEAGDGIPSIGKPIGNTQIYILDEQLQLVSLGVAGELYIGGAGVARGYYQHPELTQEKFIANPFGDGRLYRTGDLGRYLPNGEIEFLGRADNQVKHHGFRIELAEIEAAIADHPNVRDCVVVSRDDRLVAYVATKDEISLPELRTLLRQSLPVYMLPGAFVFLDSLPLSPNGKVDRNSLPDPDHSRPELDHSFVAARTPVEELLVSIWRELLRVDRVGIYDNFFDLGGHSLSATQLVSRIHDTFQKELAVSCVFESPTIAGLAQQISQSEKSLSKTSIARTSREGPVPLSFAQQRLWFIDQLEPGAAVYNIPAAMLFKGGLNVTVLEQSLNEILRRHEALRTSFATVNGQPSQVIAPVLALSLPVIDLTHLSSAERDAMVQQLAVAEADKPFDLTQVPLLRATILQLNEQEHVLLLTMHHIISDGWSMSVLIREIAAIYEALSAGNPSSLPELPVQYADFVNWQQQRLNNGYLKTQLEYWKEQLKDANALMELPTDRPRPVVQTFRGANLSILIDQTLSEAVKRLSRREGVTLFMTLLAAFKVLLYRYSNQSDISVGTVVANRNRSELEELIGFFVNTLVLRSDMSGNPSFREFLRQVRDLSLAVYANQDLPFERLVQELHPERNLSRTPLISVMFILQNAPVQTFDVSGLTLTPLEFNGNVARLDLTLTMMETGAGLHASIEYNTDLFDEATVGRLFDHLQLLLQSVTLDPEQRISGLPLLTRAEQIQLEEWNQTRRDYPFQTIPQLFEQQVARSPHAIALICERQQLNYQELNQRANQLAHHLQRLGVGPEVLVGICAERSLDTVIAILAILKAGGAYLPLDPTYPKERLAFMLEDAQVELLVTQRAWLSILPAQRSVICLDTIWEEVAGESALNPGNNCVAANLAYVMYTSGSTGKPKGVLALHGGTINRFNWMWETYPFETGEVCCQKTSLSFGDSIWEIFGPLLKGVATVIIPDQVVKDPERLVQLLSVEQVSRIVLVPSLLRAILKTDIDLDSTLPRLKYWTSSGEALPAELCRSLQERKSNCVLVNLYGSTEVSADATCYQVDRGPLFSVPIGRPIANSEVYILDGLLQPVALGVTGELHLGGAGLARGYLRRPELTADKFIPHPFKQGERLYRTGDLARYLSGGQIEYLGRVDQQVKVRGFRVEPGEIAAVLVQHPAIRESVVVAREDRLVAYVVTAEDAPAIGELRALLQDKLPAFMIPSAFVFLETLPCTTSGKLDRKSLPAPEFVSERVYRAPRTAVEEIIAGIWSQLLGVEQVGVDDNFFELGGHSLLATQVISRVRTSLEVEVAVATLFHAPVLASFAQEVTRGARPTMSQSIVVQPRDTALPLSYAQERLWFLEQLTPGNSADNIPLAVRLKGKLNVPALEASFNEIVRRHEILRTTFTTIDGNPLQVIQRDNLKVELQTFRVQALACPPGQEAREEANTPFDLTTGPLLRVKLLQLDPEEHVLLLTLHHIVSDGWSIGVFLQELSTLYDAYCQDLPSPLPALPLQYADFAVWQRAWLAEETAAQLAYWQAQLAGVSRLQLPTDRPRPAVRSFNGAIHTMVLPPELLVQLKQLSQRHGVTLFMTLLATFKVLLYRYSHQADIAVGTPIANRTRAELEPLIGCFINTLVLRTDLDGNPTFSALLERVRKVALAAYAQQDLPFEKLVEALQPQRELSSTPLFQVMFVLQNAPLGEPQLAGLEVNALTTESNVSRFELTLAMAETTAGLTATFEYNTDLFNAETISRMAGHLTQLLEAVVGDPTQSIATLPLLTVNEQQQLAAWNNTAAEYPTDKCIHELFAEQVARTPEALALVCGAESLTYAELDHRSNQVAHYLRSLGVGPEVVVGICVERNVSMVVGLLGILKAGGAYLPLDPEYPQDRLDYMVADAGAKVVLTESAGETPALRQQRLPLVAQGASWGQTREANNLTSPPEPSSVGARGSSPATSPIQPNSGNLAYVIYTSGSTGKPKGVAVEHRSLLNLIHWQQQTYSIGPTTRSSQIAAPGFDAVVWELWPYLASGASIHIVPDECRHSPGSLVQWLHEQSITISFLPTPLADAVLVESWPHDIKLERLMTGGDKLQRRPGPQLPFQLFNHYGPTESTVAATATRVDAGDGTPSIGKPIGNTQVYILDAQQQAVPVGVVGELYIGGAGVARGYYRHPELTDSKFIENPFGPGRLYRSGDLGRYLPSGEIEFLGRTDNQVKLRGFRIELGEIEAVLSQHATIKESAVLALDDGSVEKRLVAYVVWKDDSDISGDISVGELREWLKQKLPAYMVPAAFVVLDTLPLSANGKVDRHRLPCGPTTKGEVHIPPRDLIELQLAGIWEELLNVNDVGVTDNFFDLGGHSLLAVRLMAHIQKQFGHALPLSTLLQEPTIEHLARLLRESTSTAPASALVAINSNGSKTPFFCVHPTGGTVLCYFELSRALGTDQPFYGLQAAGLDGKQEPRRTIAEMAANYIEALRTIQPEGPYLIGGWSFGGMVAFEMAQQLHKQNQEVALLALIDIHARQYENKLAQLDLDEQLEEARRTNAEVPQVRNLVEVHKTNLEALYDYRPARYENRITLFRASDRADVSADPSLGWSKLSTQPVEIEVIPGTHESMLTKPNVQVLAARLSASLRLFTSQVSPPLPQ